MPSDKQKAANQSEMLEEGIRGHEPLVARGYLPEAESNQCRHQRKTPERNGSEPPVEAREDHDRGAQLQSDHGDGHRGRWRKAEMLHLGDSAVEIGRLDDP